MIERATLESLILEVTDSSKIEGEFLNTELVRSSIARKLGIESAEFSNIPRNIDGVVDVLLDATQNYDQPLSQERLLGWHHSLFQSMPNLPNLQTILHYETYKIWSLKRC